MPTNATEAAAPLAVPAALIAGGPQPSVVLFDRRGHVADPLISRTVLVLPADIAAFDAFLCQRLPGIARTRRLPADARAWALCRVLGIEAARALPAIPQQSNVLSALSTVVGFVAEHLPAGPGDYLAEVGRGGPASAHPVARALYAAALGIAEGLDDRESLTALLLAGLFADIAKDRLHDTIVSHPGPLTEDDRALVRQHPVLAVELLKRAGLRSSAVLRAVQSHHERWAGEGYPAALRGNAIPIEARIVAIADAYAALTEARPYRTALLGYDALLAMVQSEGQFEPRLLRSFVRALGHAAPSPARPLADDGGSTSGRIDAA